MQSPKELFYEKRGKILVNNLINRHFEAYFCANKEIALKKAMELIPNGASVGWGGVESAKEIGLIKAIQNGNFLTFDRTSCVTDEDRVECEKKAMFSDVFLTGANAMSLDGQMVNIDGTGNRVAAIVYGPKSVVVIVGMNKVCDSLDDAIIRARSVAAPMNMQRFGKDTPCAATGVCGDCKKEGCICNQILVTRHCRPNGRIKFIVVGEDLGY